MKTRLAAVLSAALVAIPLAAAPATAAPVDKAAFTSWLGGKLTTATRELRTGPIIVTTVAPARKYSDVTYYDRATGALLHTARGQGVNLEIRCTSRTACWVKTAAAKDTRWHPLKAGAVKVQPLSSAATLVGDVAGKARASFDVAGQTGTLKVNDIPGNASGTFTVVYAFAPRMVDMTSTVMSNGVNLGRRVTEKATTRKTVSPPAAGTVGAPRTDTFTFAFAGA